MTLHFPMSWPVLPVALEDPVLPVPGVVGTGVDDVCFWLKESLINSEIPATQGSVAIFDEYNSLKMKESENHAFHFPCSEKSRMD